MKQKRKSVLGEHFDEITTELFKDLAMFYPRKKNPLLPGVPFRGHHSRSSSSI